MNIKKLLSIIGVIAILATMAASVIPALPALADSATLYWVGGSGNWTDSAHWSTTSGGTGGHAAPGTTNAVVFDSNSFDTTGESVTLNGSPNNALSIDMSAVTNSPTIIASNSSLGTFGNISIPASVTISGNVNYGDYSASPVTVSIAPSINGGFVACEISGAVMNLGCPLSGNSSSSIYTSADSIFTHGYAVNVGYVHFAGGCTFNATNSTITMSNAQGLYNYSTGALTFTGSTLIFNANVTLPGGQTYNAVEFNGTGTSTIAGSSTFASLALGGGASQIVNFTDGTTTTVGTLTTDGLAKNLQGSSTGGWNIAASGSTINLDNLTISYSAASPASHFYYGYNSTISNSTGWTYGTTGTGAGLSASTNIGNTSVTLNGVISLGTETSLATEFEYGLTSTYGSTVTVTGSPITSNGPVTANVTGLTAGTTYHYRITAVGNSIYHSADGVFTTSGGAAGSYWVGGSGSWSDAANHWASNSNGTPGAGNLPTSSSNVYFDSNSFTAANQIVTVDATAYCANIVWTGASHTPTLALTSSPLMVYGSVFTLISSMHLTNINTVIRFAPSSNVAITSAGNNLGNLSVGNYTSGTLTFTDTAFLTGISYGAATSASKVVTNGQIVILTGTTLTNTGSVTFLANLLGIGSYPVSVVFSYGTSTSYGATLSAINEISLGNYSTSITGLLGNMTYHYRIQTTSNSVISASSDMTFTTPAADDAPYSITPASQSQTFDLPLSDAELISGGYAYFDGRQSGLIYQVSLSNFSDVTTYQLPNSDTANDAMTVCDGQLWVGGGAHQDIYEVAVPAMTLTNTISVSNDYFDASATNDGTNVYFGGQTGPNICSINCSTLEITYGTVPTTYGTGMVHELVTDSNYIYGDIGQGEAMFKSNKSTLVNMALVAGSGSTTDSDELLLDPTDTYVFNLTENGPAMVKRWTTSNLAEATCAVSDAVTPGLDGMTLLSDGSILVSDITLATAGVNHFYKINPNFTYTAGHIITVSGICTYSYRDNKIYLYENNVYCMGGPFPGTSTTGIYKIPLSDFQNYNYPTLAAATAVTSATATVTGTIDNLGGTSTIVIHYGTSDAGTGTWQHSIAPTTPSQPMSAGTFTAHLTGLTQSTEYYYTVSSTDAEGTTWATASQSFITISSLYPNLIKTWTFSSMNLISLSGGKLATLKPVMIIINYQLGDAVSGTFTNATLGTVDVSGTVGLTASRSGSYVILTGTSEEGVTINLVARIWFTTVNHVTSVSSLLGQMTIVNSGVTPSWVHTSFTAK